MYTGSYKTWEEAAEGTDGYDAAVIFERNLDAARKVRDGKALFERDSVCFDQPDYRWHPLACLLAEAAARNGNLHVVDFGGSFASFLAQHRPFLIGLPGLKWSVVEQAHFVEAGRREFETERLSFFLSIDEARTIAPIDVVFFSGVLQCVPEPYKFLDEACFQGASLLIDRTQFINAAEDRIARRTVTEAGYVATIPSRFFSMQKLVQYLSSKSYSIKAEWPGFDGDDYRGMWCCPA